jgi:hypothetical protein
MKQFQSLISAALAVTIVFTACTSGDSEKETTATIDNAPSTATTATTADANPAKAGRE